MLGRPRVGLSLANAIRRRFPPERIVDMAESLAGSDDERVRMALLQWIADRGFGKVVENIDVRGGLTPEQQALFDALRLTPHERRNAEPEAAADDAAMSELVDADS